MTSRRKQNEQKKDEKKVDERWFVEKTKEKGSSRGRCFFFFLGGVEGARVLGRGTLYVGKGGWGREGQPTRTPLCTRGRRWDCVISESASVSSLWTAGRGGPGGGREGGGWRGAKGLVSKERRVSQSL